MASQWYYFTDEEFGPRTFHELAMLIAEGTLQPADLVRRQESRQWQRVDAVFGLLKAADQLRAAAGAFRQPRERGLVAGRFIKWIEGTCPGMDGAKTIVALSLLCLLGLLIEVGWFWWQRPPRFPARPRSPVVMQVPSRLQQIRRRSPSIPSVPDLPVGKPVLVPGFEEVTWMKSPTLSADMLTVIYVGYAGEQLLDELMIANRRSIQEPFSGHRPLQVLNSPDREAQPALSPDGQDLLFVRQKGPARLWSSRRKDRTSAFEPPVEVTMDLPDPAQLHFDAPQFLDENKILVTVSDLKFTERKRWIATRSGSSRLKPNRTLSFDNPWPRYFVTSGGQRAYVGTEGGLQITAVSSRAQQYTISELIAGTEVTGPDLTAGDDTIWVCPAEDVIFFCGPGAAPASTSDRRFWMLRF